MLASWMVTLIKLAEADAQLQALASPNLTLSRYLIARVRYEQGPAQASIALQLPYLYTALC